MGADTPQIAVGSTDGGLHINLLGRATQRTVPTADRLVSDYLAAKPDGPLIAIDLEGCEWVDSTCAGWIVALTRRAKSSAGGRVVLSRCSERCQRSLSRMGLTPLLTLEDVAAPQETRTVPCQTRDQLSKTEVEFMLAAHEELAAVNEQNQQVFGPIATALRGQAGKKDGASAS